MEHKNLWPLEGQAPPEDHLLEFGKAREVTAGDDLTIVSWSAMVHVCADAAAALADEGIGAHLLDLRTLWPWDKEAVFASVRRTGRLLIVHESVTVGGFGAEVAAEAAGHLFSALRAPVRRLGSPRIPISYAPNLEDQARVKQEDILAAAREMMAEGRRA